MGMTYLAGTHALRDWNFSDFFDFESLQTNLTLTAFCPDCPDVEFSRSVKVSDEILYGDKPDTATVVDRLMDKLYHDLILIDAHDTVLTEANYLKFSKHYWKNFENKWAITNPCADISVKSLTSDELEAAKVAARSAQLALWSDDLPGAKYVVECPAENCTVAKLQLYTDDNGADKYKVVGHVPVKDFLSDIVIHLNDDHRWTREAIAEWLENIHDPTGEHGPDLRFKVKEEA